MIKHLLACVVCAWAASSDLAIGQQASGAAQPTPPRSMSRRDLESEVTTLRSIVNNHAVLAQRPDYCGASEDRQFDFWVGEWDVSGTGHQAIVAESTITLADQGCLVLENWRPFSGGSAHSISVYDHAQHHWRQFYAGAGSPPGEYIGTLGDDGVLRFDISSGPQRQRMNYQRISANAVRQWGERYDEATHAWAPTWDLTYRRRGIVPPP